MIKGSIYPEAVTDFYCEGFRYFDNYEETKKEYEKNQGTDLQGWYGQDVLSFKDITELNSVIQKLILLRDSINLKSSRHPNIQREFGNNQILSPLGNAAKTYPMD